MSFRFHFGSCALLAFILLGVGNLQAQPVPEGPETAFYTAYLAQAVGPSVAFDADGDLAAMLVRGPVDFQSCMRSWGPCQGSADGLLIDRFGPQVQSSLGANSGAVPHVDTEPQIVRDGDGFVAVWVGRTYCNIRFNFCSPTDGSGSAIFGRRLGPAGPLGEVFLINAHSEGEQHSPALSVSPRGGFTVVWRSEGADRPGILARSFGEQGEPRAEFRVSLTGVSPQVAHGPDGEVLIVWEETSGLHARLFDPEGLPLGARHRIDDSTFAVAPVLVALPGGGFVVGWVESAAGAITVRVRRLDARGWPEGSSVAASFLPEDLVDLFDLAVDETGGVLVAWWGVQAAGDSARQGIFATYLDAGGNPLWRSQPLSGERAETQMGVRVASDGRRAFAVTWLSPVPDPVYPGVVYYARRLVLPGGTCGPDPLHLCLQGRFSVESRWRAGATGGDGLAVPYASSAGFFAFHDLAGWDLGVKILDTRSRNSHFALFEANLFEPESWVRTLDTVTGQVRIDHSAAGELCGQRDGRAFDAGLAAEDNAREAVRTCRPGPASLCLLGGRFLVRMHWNPKPAGPPVLAHAVAGSDRSGLFWLTSADNPAAVVQIVDGRGVNGKFWVFSSGLVPRDFKLTVTDLATGAGKTFIHTAEETCGVADTDAF